MSITLAVIAATLAVASNVWVYIAHRRRLSTTNTLPRPWVEPPPPPPKPRACRAPLERATEELARMEQTFALLVFDAGAVSLISNTRPGDFRAALELIEKCEAERAARSS